MWLFRTGKSGKKKISASIYIWYPMWSQNFHGQPNKYLKSILNTKPESTAASEFTSLTVSCGTELHPLSAADLCYNVAQFLVFQGLWYREGSFSCCIWTWKHSLLLNVGFRVLAQRDKKGYRYRVRTDSDKKASKQFTAGLKMYGGLGEKRKGVIQL